MTAYLMQTGHTPGERLAYPSVGTIFALFKGKEYKGIIPPYVVINYPGGWDTHSNHFMTMRRQCPQLDQGLATLLQDLKDRGLLETTIVWCTGEFGRGPKVDWQPPWNGGRSHYGNVYSILVAGGGFKGGHIVGSSDAKGAEPKDRPARDEAQVSTSDILFITSAIAFGNVLSPTADVRM